MTCEEFLKKWSFLPHVRYSFGMYSVDAFYITIHIKVAGESLGDILINIDKIITEFGSNQEKEASA